MTDVKGTFSDDKWSWAEDRPGGGGGGPRSMKIMGPGIERGGLLFGVDPNPHANSAYNDGGQTSLYAGFVKQMDTGWPTKKKAAFTKAKEVGDIKDTKLKAQMLKMDKKKQDQALKDFNEKGEKESEDKAQESYVEAVVNHLKSKKGKVSFTLGSETYKLG